MSDAAALTVLVFAAALLQASLFSSLDVLGGTADVLLLVLIGIALLRGAVTGAVAGFGGGLLLDVLTLDTLGVTALVLSLAGYWTGRYGETTGRGRLHAPILAVVVVTVLAALLGFLGGLEIISISGGDRLAPDNFLHLFSGIAAITAGALGAKQTDDAVPGARA